MRRLETAFVVLSIVVLSDVLDAPLEQVLAASGAVLGIPIKRLLLLPTFLGSAVLAMRLWPLLRWHGRELWPVAALVGLAVVSALWSPLPAATILWSLGLAGTTLFGIVLGLRVDGEQQLRLIALTLVAVVAASLIGPLFLAGPKPNTFGVRGGAWVGLFYDNNLFGRIIALAALVCIILAASARRRAVPSAAGAASVLVLYGTHSLTAEVALVAGLATAGLLWAGQRLPRRWRPGLLAAAVLVCTLIGAAFVAQPQRLLGVVGKNPRLSGRVQIWTEVAGRIAERPWLGSGYGAFWSGIVRDPRPGWHAHNGYLDLTAELGLVGLALFAVPFAIAARRAALTALAEPSLLALWPPAYLAFLAVMNLAESCLLRHKLTWALYVAALLWQPPPNYGSRA